MFWLGTGIFIVLAVLPFIAATVLNARDGTGVQQPTEPEER